MTLFEGLITALIPISGALSVVIDRWLKGRADRDIDAAQVESLNVQTTDALVAAVRHELQFYTEQLTLARNEAAATLRELGLARQEIHSLSNQVSSLQQAVRDLGGDPTNLKPLE